MAEKLNSPVFREEAGAQDFRDALLAGLSRTPKSVPCRFLYDDAGSALFERICETPEYYLTRTETGILLRHARDMATLIGPDCVLIELGSGSSRKTRILLDALERPRAYVPIDISREPLRAAAAALARNYPSLDVVAICADYHHALVLPEFPRTGRKLGFFPGSTIGNLTPAQAKELLSRWGSQLGPGSAMLVGVDLKKEARILDAAYNDAEGVTAAFIKNVLLRANRELDADFVPRRFALDSRYVASQSRVEIYLSSITDQTVHVAGKPIHFAAGEAMHIEYSFKYTVGEFQAVARAACFEPTAVWLDPGEMFSVHYLRWRRAQEKLDAART